MQYSHFFMAYRNQIRRKILAVGRILLGGMNHMMDVPAQIVQSLVRSASLLPVPNWHIFQHGQNFPKACFIFLPSVYVTGGRNLNFAKNLLDFSKNVFIMRNDKYLSSYERNAFKPHLSLVSTISFVALNSKLIIGSKRRNIILVVIFVRL